jgi:hypothetical protein
VATQMDTLCGLAYPGGLAGGGGRRPRHALRRLAPGRQPGRVSADRGGAGGDRRDTAAMVAPRTVARRRDARRPASPGAALPVADPATGGPRAAIPREAQRPRDRGRPSLSRGHGQGVHLAAASTRSEGSGTSGRRGAVQPEVLGRVRAANEQAPPPHYGVEDAVAAVCARNQPRRVGDRGRGAGSSRDRPPSCRPGRGGPRRRDRPRAIDVRPAWQYAGETSRCSERTRRR